MSAAFYEARTTPFEQWIAANAVYYTAALFTGRGFDRRRAATFDGAVRLAASLYTSQSGARRGVMIYAVNATDNQAMLGTFEERSQKPNG